MIKINRRDRLSSEKMLCDVAYDLFLNSREVFCAKATINIYKFQKKQIVRAFEDQYMEDITPTMIRQLLAEFHETHNDGGTFRLYSSIRAFFNWYWHEYDVAIRNPISKVTCKKPAFVPIQGISRDEINKILLAISKSSKFPERDRVLVNLLADTGLRRSSISNLRFKDVDVETCTLFVFEKDQQYHTKPFGKETQKAIRKYLKCLSDNKPDDNFWVNIDGSTMNFDGMRQMLQRMETIAGIPHYQFHAFRRFFGLELYKSTRDIFFVSRALDHKNVEVTKRYLAIDDAESTAMLRAMSPMDNNAKISLKK